MLRDRMAHIATALLMLGNDALRADAVHLDSDGYRALAGNVAEELRNPGYLRR